MRQVFSFLLVCTLLVLAGGPASATTYYVATNGNDSWPGTDAQPWLTLQHAVDTIANGDTIIVKDGTYWGCRIENSGASGAPKTLKAQNHLGAVLNHKGSYAVHNSVVELENAGYWVIQDFRVNGMASYVYGIDVRVCNNITVRKNDAHSTTLTGIMTAHSYYSLVEENESHECGEHGFYMADSSDYGTLRKNYSWGNTRCGFHHNGGLPDGGDGQMSYWLDEKNRATGNPGAAFNYDGVSDSKMINNLAYKNSHLGFALYCLDGAEGSRRNLIYNNTVYFTTAGYDCVSISNYGSPAIDNKIKNNILIQERTGYSSICGYSSSMGSGFQSDYNVVVDRFSIDDGNTVISLATWRTYGYDTHSQISNASTEFVDAANNDYHLKAGAKAINGGTTLSEVTDDMDGVARPQGGAYDCGCYESTSGVPDLVITTTSLAEGRVGTAYSQTLQATGGVTPYTWSVMSGSLPAGLSLGSSTGTISGTPTASGTSNFTVRVTDSQTPTPDTDDQALSIVIYADLVITTTSVPNATVGLAYSQTLAATGGKTPYSWSVVSGSLPAGLSLGSSTGTISGTPTASGTSNFTVRVTDSQSSPDTDDQALSITVPADLAVTTSSLPAGQIGVAYSQTLAASGGVTPYSWSLQSGSLPAGLSLSSGGVISGTPTASGTSNFTVRVTDSQTPADTATKALSITIPADLVVTTASLPNGQIGVAYSQTLSATGGVTPYSWSLQSGSLPAGLSLSSGGVISGTPTASGTSNFTVRVTDSQTPADTATKALSITIPADLVVTTTSLPNGTVGVAYSQTLAASGGVTPYSWSLQSGSLPAGLSLSSGGVISGTPTTAGTSNFTVRVTDSQTPADTATKALSIVINAGIADLVITTTSLPAGTVGVAYSQTVQATGGVAPYTWSVVSGSLPAGLSLGSASGTISGTPTASGTSNFTVRVTDSQTPTPDTDDQALSIVVNPADLQITTTSLPAGTVGVAYSQTVQATGGVTPYTWSVVSGSLPAGLSLGSSTGTISGTPTASGTSNFTIRVTDSQTPTPDTDDQALSIVINPAGGQTYYVATNGNDSWPGTEAQPWLTIQHAVDTIAGGDTIIVKSGTYAGFRARYSGASGAVKTVKSQTVGGAVINTTGPQCTKPCNVEVKADTPANGIAYWVVEGFDVTSSPNWGVEIQYGDHVTVKNCKSHNNAAANITMQCSNYCTLEGDESYSPTSGSGFFIGESGDNNTVRNNISRNTPSSGFLITSQSVGDKILNGWLVEKNSAYSNSSRAFACDGMENSTLRNNLAYGQVRGLLLIGYESASSSRNNRVLNNTILVSSPAVFDCVYIHRYTAGLPEAVGNKLFNNVLYNYDTGGTIGSICIDTAAETNFESNYNVVMNVFGLDDHAQVLTLAQWQALGYDLNSIQAADTALFVNPSGNDYHLKSGSPAINAGTTLADVTDDKEGAARPQGTAYDIGCYEYAIADLVVTTSSLPNGQIGVAYSQTLAASGGVTPYSWSLQSGSLPAGLSLSSGGVVSGTPTTAGTSNFTVQVTDSQTPADTATKALSIAIPADLVVTTSSLPNGQIGVAYSQTLAGSGGVTPYSWSLASGSLPAGLSLSSGGVISGTPTASGTSNFTVRVTDSQTPADTATKALSIAIPADLAVTTTTLPNGTVGVAYSQTVAATGGVTPYSWSVVSGSLPAGLSLGSSTGVIGGTPTTAGTSNFTVRATDSQVPADTDDQALSIVINTGVSSTYEFAANDTEGSTTSTSWQTRTTLSFTPTVADDWIILGFAEYKGSSASYSVLVRMTVDGTSEGEITVEPTVTGDYQTFTAAKAINLSAASHTVNVQYCSENAAATAYLRNARVVAIRKAALEWSAAASDSTTALTTTMTNYATLNWTPATSGDYLLIWSAEASARTGYSTQIEARYNGATWDSSLVETKDNADYYTFISFDMVTCPASQQTMTVAAAKESGSTSTHNIRRARVAAIRLSGGRFGGYQYAYSDTESTTTATTFQQKLTKSWSATAGNYLLLTSFRLAGSSTSYSTEGRAQLDDATTLGQPLRRPKDTTDYMNAGCVDVRNLTAGTRYVDVDYRSSSASGTAKIRYVHLVALPL